MFRLIIKYQNGDVYWRESFNSMAELNAWLAEERTRSYWKEEFTTEVQDLTPPPPTQEQIDQQAALQLQIATLKARIKVLAGQSDLTAAEIKEALMKFIKIQLLRKALD